jgi:hypothetical protein
MAISYTYVVPPITECSALLRLHVIDIDESNDVISDVPRLRVTEIA